MKTMMLLLTLYAAVAAEAAIAAAPPAPPSPAQPVPSPNAVRAACETDVPKVCPGVQPGGGRIIQCLVQHQNEVSVGCKQTLRKAKQGSA